MAKNKSRNRVLLLPILFVIAWFYGALNFVVYDWIYLIPALFILLVIIYLSVWTFRLRRWLSLSKAPEQLLNSIMIGKIKISVFLFLAFWVVSALVPPIAYPVIYIAGVFVSFSAFSNYRRQDVVQIKELLLKDEHSCDELKCFKILCGGITTAYSVTDGDVSAAESNEGRVVNPTTGLPMIGGMSGVDTGGNPYGINSNQDNNY